MIAIAFIESVMANRTTPAAAALLKNFGSGRDTQLKSCIGSTVNSELNHPSDTKGGSLLNGDGGRNAM